MSVLKTQNELRSKLGYLHTLWCIVAFITMNVTAQENTSTAVTNRWDLTEKRARAAAERAEAAAKRAEAAARKAEIALKELQVKFPISPAQNQSDDSLSVPEDEDLRRVRFVAEKKLYDFNKVEREARVWLTKDNKSPPAEVAATFEVADEDVFVTVKFARKVGETFWYVKYNRNLEVEEWGMRQLTDND